MDTIDLESQSSTSLPPSPRPPSSSNFSTAVAVPSSSDQPSPLRQRRLAASSKVSTHHFPSVPNLWPTVSSMLLDARVLLDSSDAAASLEKILESNIAEGSDPQIHTIVAGTAEFWSGMTKQARLRRILSLAPTIRQLVIIYAENSNPGSSSTAPPRQPFNLPFLRDATIISSSHTPLSKTTCNIAQDLPPSLRFLEVSGVLAISETLTASPPAFHLYGLTCQKYPSEATEWVLKTSRDTLKCLSVAELRHLGDLAENHPHLRSLRLLDRDNMSLHNIGRLSRLERLEIWAPVIKDFNVATLPLTLRRIRIWSTDAAMAIAEALESPDRRHELSNLEIMIWDYWPARSQAVQRTLERLGEACRAREVVLARFGRIGQGRWPSVGADSAYESTLRASCFSDEEKLHDKQGLSPQRPVYQPVKVFPPEVFSTMVSKDVPLDILQPHSTTAPAFANLQPILEDCLPGLMLWAKEVFQKLVAQRKRLMEFTNLGYSLGQAKILARVEDYWRNVVVISSLVIWAVSTAIIWKFFKHRPGSALLLAFVSGGVIVAMRLSYLVLQRYDVEYPQDVLNSTAKACTIFVLCQVAYMINFIVVADSENRVAVAVLGGIGVIVLSAFNFILFIMSMAKHHGF